MIAKRIKQNFIHQYDNIKIFSNNIYIADYTEKTKGTPITRDVEFFSPTPPTDIDYFSIINPKSVEISGIKFDNRSFVYSNGNSKSQCEAVFFPSKSKNNSWILFCELKYSNRPVNNENNLRKALKQLFKTRYYYVQTNIITDSNTCYLIASLPMQSEPFPNFSLTQSCLTDLKVKRNIILRLKNSVEILDIEKIIA